MLSRLSIQDRARILNYTIIIALVLFLAEGVYLLALTQREDVIAVPSISTSEIEEAQVSELEIVGENLFLGQPTVEIIPIDLEQQIRFSLYDVRPDKKEVRTSFHCTLVKSGESKECFSKEKIYLTKDRDQRLVFSTEKSSFWFEPHLLPSKKIFVKVGMDLPERATLSTEAKTTFSLAAQELGVQKDKEHFPPYMRVLSEGKWWGKDLFTANKNGAERIELGSDNAYFCPIDLKNTRAWLVWKDGKWQVSDLEEGANQPIARAQGFLHANAMVFEGWNEEGTEKYAFSIEKQPLIPISVRSEDLLISPHVRTKRQISCFCGKERLLLREGDCIIYKKGKWRRFIPSNDNTHEGELFCFEKIVDEGGEKVLKGSLYNQMHTQKMNISKPILRQPLTGMQKMPPPQSSYKKNENSTKRKMRTKK